MIDTTHQRIPGRNADSERPMKLDGLNPLVDSISPRQTAHNLSAYLNFLSMVAEEEVAGERFSSEISTG